jgi:hypothetical protein
MEVEMFKYIGKGFIPGVPARDLEEEEVKSLEIEFIDEAGKPFTLKGEKALLKTGLYEKAAKKQTKHLPEGSATRKEGE